MSQKQLQTKVKGGGSRNSFWVSVGGVGVEGMMEMDKIGALV